MDSDDDVIPGTDDGECVIDFASIFIVYSECRKLLKVQPRCRVNMRCDFFGGAFELCRKIRFDSRHDKKTIHCRIDLSGPQQDLIGCVPRFCRSRDLFEKSPDFIPGPVTQPVMDTIDNGGCFRWRGVLLLQKLCDDV